MNKNETVKKEEKIKELMSMSVAAERLDICYRTLQSLVYERKIGFVKVGRHYKFRKEDIDKFIEKNFIKPVK
jgi:excisionase family DNA binding protein